MTAHVRDRYVLTSPDAETTTEYPTRCTRCARPVHHLSVFPGGRCIDCHADAHRFDPMPTAEDIVRMWS